MPLGPKGETRPPTRSLQFCNCPGGGIEFGYVPDAVAKLLNIASAPIRLQI